jgi:hypothetical protein
VSVSAEAAVVAVVRLWRQVRYLRPLDFREPETMVPADLYFLVR